MSPLPRITVVTPSFNQGRYLEGTIRSVLDQQYPNVEHLVVDGGSTDESVDVLQRYSDQLAFWVSEPDRGQSDAINKGFARSTGDIIGWLNSDDRLLPGALWTIARALRADDADVVVGHCRFEYEATGDAVTLRGEYTDRARLLRYWYGYRMHQPAIWWRRRVYETIGGLDTEQHLIMDFDYWVRMADAGFRFVNVDEPLAVATYHADAKTGDGYRSYYAALRRYVPRALGHVPPSPGWVRTQAALHAHRAVTGMRRPLRPSPLR